MDGKRLMTNAAPATAVAMLPPATLFPGHELLASDSVGGLVPLHGRVIFAAALGTTIMLEVSVQDR
jgi:hypothetical protein